MVATKPTRRKPQFVCPECGFRAVHAMGLGRHRSARHGVKSKRQQVPSGLERRIEVLERRQEQLVAGLERLVSEVKRARRQPPS